MGQVGNWVFIAFFIAQGWRCLSGANRSFLGRRSISLANYHLLGPPADISWEGEVSPRPIITFWDLLQSVLQLTNIPTLLPNIWTWSPINSSCKMKRQQSCVCVFTLSPSQPHSLGEQVSDFSVFPTLSFRPFKAQPFP
jgi:hypothetical protein